MNVLLSSAGRRVELLRCLEADLAALSGGAVVAADASDAAPCMRLAQRAVVLPRLDAPTFEAELAAALERLEIGLVVPTIDTELPVYAGLRERLDRAGVRVLLSGRATIDIAADKALTSRFLAEAGLSAPESWSAEDARRLADRLPYPLIAKPRFGSSSIGVLRLDTADALRALVGPDHVVQELAGGVEHTVDVWVDEAGRVRSCVPRRRIRVRGGEVSEGRTERAPQVEDLARQVAEALPDAFGPLTIQLMSDGDRVVVIEVNARYGGGFPLTWRAGARTTRWALQYGLGVEPDPAELPWREGLVMARYDESVFFDDRGDTASESPKTGTT